MVVIGKHYKHFKGFKVDELVIYEEESSRKVWARPKEMLLSKVDKDKYPASAQNDHFLKIDD